MNSKNDLKQLKAKVQKFCEARDWDQFHGAKDLAIGIITEASELLEHFRFKNEKETADLFKNKAKKEEISDELADVLFFIVRFAQRYDIDLGKAFERKMKKINRNYPVSKAKGSNRKYTEL
jgi:NTP pyrophosphatase (non-canonical NTP hydrolase)